MRYATHPWACGPFGAAARLAMVMTAVTMPLLAGCEEPGEVYPEVNEDLPAPAANALDTLRKGFDLHLAEALAGEAELKGLHAFHDDRAAKTDGAEAIHLKFGRTSVRLRNKANTMPKWATRTLRASGDEKTHRMDKNTFTFDIGTGRRGHLEAIGTRIECIRCHGRDAVLGDKVRDKIKAQFPNDEAVDYKGGELRGWFWLEYDAAK